MRQKLLYLTHRIPFPPNKGDKVRSFHLLKHLALEHDVLLGSFVDDPDDMRFLDELRRYCVDLHIEPLAPRTARLKSLTGLLRGEALTLPYYRNTSLASWVDSALAMHGIRRALVFSSAMAQYVIGRTELDVIVDFVDVDSDKWRQYGDKHAWPWSAVYRREGSKLLEYERKVARQARESFFVTDAEAALFRRLAPESADRVSHFCNGVDTEYFRPSTDIVSPYASDERALVFTGAMDYWPNIDAARWFADEVLPILHGSDPALRFYVVGMNPAQEILALAERPGIVVTGRVPDVRPYLQHARLAVAPLRIARGLQNKVLEAMAMARPVVVSATCAEPLAVRAGREVAVAATAGEFVSEIQRLLGSSMADEMGAAGRARVVADYNWAAHLRRVDEALARCGPSAVPALDGSRGGPPQRPRAVVNGA